MGIAARDGILGVPGMPLETRSPRTTSNGTWNSVVHSHLLNQGKHLYSLVVCKRPLIFGQHVSYLLQGQHELADIDELVD